MKKVLVLVAVSVLGAFLTVACGGGSSESAPAATPAATPAETAATPAADADAGAAPAASATP